MDRATSARPALASDAGRAVERITDSIASVVHAPRETLVTPDHRYWVGDLTTVNAASAR